ncbi:MAG: hypothetical protein ABIJ92_00665 [Candidatus Aenigmatarchaeota archaeon]
MSFDIIYFAIGVRIINSLLLLYLVIFYGKTHKKIKSGFTGGLLFFVVLLFLNNVSSVYFRLFSGIDYINGVNFHNSILNLLELGGLIALVYTTRK